MERVKIYEIWLGSAPYVYALYAASQHLFMNGNFMYMQAKTKLKPVSREKETLMY